MGFAYYTAADTDIDAAHHGKLKTVTDGQSNVTTYVYGDLSTAVTVDGHTYTFTYDDEGKLLSKKALVGTQDVITSYQYSEDGSDNVTFITDGLGNSIQFDYDAQGNQLWQQDAQGNRIKRVFNDANQVVIETPSLPQIAKGWMAQRKPATHNPPVMCMTKPATIACVLLCLPKIM